MGTKANPGKYDCYAALENDEPYFLLRSNDPLAPDLVRQWAEKYIKQKVGSLVLKEKHREKYAEAHDCADSMERWRRNNVPAERPIAPLPYRLRKARTSLGMTQQTLASRMGCHVNLIGRYETGASKPTAARVVELAVTLDVTCDYLLGLSDG